MSLSSLRQWLLRLILLVVLLGVGALAAHLYHRSSRPAPMEVPVAAEAPPLREVLLYFGSSDAGHLEAETAKIEDCVEEIDCVRSTVQALLSGPKGGLIPILPAHAEVRGVSVDAGTAVVDFSRELVSAHPGGSASELLTVYGLANTLAENYPHIRQVRFLVEGEEVETLKGHVDLSGPIQADFSLSRNPQDKQEAGGGVTLPTLPESEE